MFIRSQCNHAISFSLEAGRIYALNHGPRRGRSAIPLISQIAGGSYRFDTAGPGRPAQELRPTAEILQLLITSRTGADVQGSSSSAGGTDSISVEQKLLICQELKKLLTQHLGPIADMVFDDTVDEEGSFCSTPEKTQELIDKLATDIGDPKEIEQFRREAQKTIDQITQDYQFSLLQTPD